MDEKLKEAQQKITAYIYKAGVCRYCLAHWREHNATRCSKCLERGKAYRSAADRCSRCGMKKDDDQLNCCKRCRKN